jgi:hypothetical protein
MFRTSGYPHSYLFFYHLARCRELQFRVSHSYHSTLVLVHKTCAYRQVFYQWLYADRMETFSYPPEWAEEEKFC